MFCLAHCQVDNFFYISSKINIILGMEKAKMLFSFDVDENKALRLARQWSHRNIKAPYESQTGHIDKPVTPRRGSVAQFHWPRKPAQTTPGRGGQKLPPCFGRVI